MAEKGLLEECMELEQKLREKLKKLAATTTPRDEVMEFLSLFVVGSRDITIAVLNGIKMNDDIPEDYKKDVKTVASIIGIRT